MEKQLPNLYIPGAGKSGTTTLHELLNQHPEICMSAVKEPHYWTRPQFDHYSQKDHDDYLNLFNSCSGSKILGESSTGYMAFPSFIERIKKTYDDAPYFIFILRNPIDRCYSHFWWLKGIGSENLQLQDAVNHDKHIEPLHTTGLPEGNYKQYYQFGLYHKWLKKFYSHFPHQNIKIITFEQLKTDPLGTINDCLKFLSLKELTTILEVSENKTVILKHPKLYKLSKRLAFTKLNLPTSIRKLIPNKIRLFFREKLMKLVYDKSKTDTTYPKITPNDRDFLKTLYESDVQLLKSLTGLTFNEWTDFK